MRKNCRSGLTTIVIAIATAATIVPFRASAQDSDDSRSVCYLHIEGRTLQNLDYLCGHKLNKSGVAPANNRPTVVPQSPNDRQQLDLDEEFSGESTVPPATPSSAPSTTSSPTPNPTLTSSPTPPVTQTEPLSSIPSIPSTPFPPTTPAKPSSTVSASPVRQLPTPASTNLPASKKLNQNASKRNQNASKRLIANNPVNQPVKRTNHSKKSFNFPPTYPNSSASPPFSPLNVQTPQIAPLPLESKTQPADSPISTLVAFLRTKSLYLFWLICLPIPLLTVINGRNSSEKTQSSFKFSMLRSTFKRLQKQTIAREQGLKLLVSQQGTSNGYLSNRTQNLAMVVDETESAWQQLKQQRLSCEEALQRLVNEQGLVSLDLLDREVSDRFLRNFPERTKLLPVIPLLLWRNCYYLGSPTKLSDQEIQTLKQRLNTSVKIIPIAEKSFRQWKRVQNLQENQRLNGTSLVDSPTNTIEPEDITEVAEYHLSQVDNQVERIKALISSALRNRASDIHMAPAPDGLRVRFRIDGILRHVTTLPPDISRRVIVSLKVMCDMDISESRRPQDGRISEKYMSQQQEEDLDLRVSTVPCVGGVKGEVAEKAVLRLLRQKNSFSTIDDLGFSEKTVDIYKGWLKQPQGMVVLTGPTGSGKTSTLYTSLQSISTESVNIITVEDPVEYVLPGITQIQVNEAAGMTFAAGLRAILRQDPDIIMLGEIRDCETAETAARAALTGHLVLTTLHTNDAIGAIPRLRDMGLDPGLISDALLGVVAQRLIRKVCPHCAEPYEPTQADINILRINREEANPQNWRKGKGCSHCFNTGFLGREAIIELLNVDNSMRQIIHEGNILQLHRYLNKIQFDSFRKAVIAKVTAGITTIEEVRRVLPYSVLGHYQVQVDDVER